MHLEQGVAHILMDGQEITGNILPDMQDNKMHDVQVTLCGK